MDPKVIKFMYFNGFVVLLLVGYIFFSRAKPKPTRLKLRESKLRYKGVSAAKAPADDSKERQLNVIFTFNGHDFDAYEVLGVAAGSSVSVAEMAFIELTAKEDHDSHELYRIAFESIRKMKQNNP